jgi:pyruvate dehydrogenase phosphatase
MGNRVARLATPCFATPADGCVRGHRADDGAAADVRTNGAAGDGGSSRSVVHILSFDGREGPAFAGAIHGVLLPSNQSTLGSGGGGGSVLNDLMSFSGSSSFDSSNSFSFRTLQPRQYSGQLEYSTSPSTSATTSGVSVSRQLPRTDEQILADLRATRHRRQCLQASKPSPLLGGLRRAVASVLRASPCVSPGRNLDRGEHVGVAVGNGGVDIGAAIGSNHSEGGEAATDDGAARVEWARGKAGEDRVHLVMSEEHGWMFVGIYDGFNGPDATDYLVAHLYNAVCRELDGVLSSEDADPADRPDGQEQHPPRCNGGRRHSAAGEGEQEQEVLDALERALKSTEAAFFAEAEARAAECPELAMMGSCVLVVLMKGADVYVMNVGDSRAVLAQRAAAESPPQQPGMGELAALQLTMDHSTSVYMVIIHDH